MRSAGEVSERRQFRLLVSNTYQRESPSTSVFKGKAFASSMFLRRSSSRDDARLRAFS
jgi:hypothetical protein